MMNRVWISEIPLHVGERVRVTGWLQRLRRLSRVSFLVVRDRTGIVQAVVDTADGASADGHHLHETVVSVIGTAIASPQAPGGVELHEPEIEVISDAVAPPPIDLFRPTLTVPLPTILDHASLALRHPRQRAIFQVASASLSGFRATLRSQGFVEVQTPKIVGSATESGANVFTLDYFGQPAYLAQSPQLYKQMLVGVFERVFETGPVFRAEPHDTPRHLNEYVSLDVEFGFIDDHRTVMTLLTNTLRGMVEAIRREAAPAIAILGTPLPEIPSQIPDVHFADALDRIWRATGEDVRDEPDLAPAHEQWLGAWARREFGSDFLFVVGYPMAKRPFYTHPDPDRPRHSNSFDLLFRGVELVTGGQRLHRYTDYLAAFAERGIDPAPLSAYLDAFKYGMPPHGGFAIGLERWVARIIGAANVRETTIFPRDLHRLMP